MYLFLDTETNTLANFGKDADAPGQPRLAEIGLILTDADFKVTAEYQSYVQPGDWEMYPDAFKKHGLTLDFLREHGRPIEMVLPVYIAAINEGRGVICHNAQFDCKVMRGELRRAGLPDLFEQTPNFCTMRGDGIMKLGIQKTNGKGGFPRLQDLCAHCGVKYNENEAHGAMYDARATRLCLMALAAAGFEFQPEVHYSKNLEAIRANR